MALLYTLSMAGVSIWMGRSSRVLPLGLQFLVALYFFLFGGLGVYFLLGESDFSLLVVSCVNQLLALLFLLSVGVGKTPNPLPSNLQLWKWTGLSMLIGASSLISSGLLLELFESLGGQVEQQGLVDLLADGKSVEKGLTILLVVGLAPVAEELLFRGSLLPWLIDKVGEWAGIIVTGLLFGLLHFETPSAVPPLIIFGTVLSWWSRHTGWVIFPILAHFCNNAFVVWSL